MSGDGAELAIDEPTTRGWRWYTGSASESPQSLSVLAVVETLFATGMYAWMAWAYGTTHLLVSACVTPFLLLRTPRSTARGLKMADALSAWFSGRLDLADSETSGRFALLVFPFQLAAYVSALAAGSVAIRILATLYTIGTHPLHAIREIPSNWWRFVSHLDLTVAPEAIPGVNRSTRTRSRRRMFLPASAIRAWLRQKPTPNWFSNALLRASTAPYVVVVAIFMLLPAIAYRWAIKGTSLIYAPFIWIVRTSFRERLEDRVKDVRDLALPKAVRRYALVVLTLFVAKLCHLVAPDAAATLWEDYDQLWDAARGVPVLRAYLAPGIMPPWHVAMAANAALAWVLYFTADWAASRYERKKPPNEVRVGIGIRWLTLVRGTLSIYTILCGLYTAASLIPELGWAPLGPRLFPW